MNVINTIDLRTVVFICSLSLLLISVVIFISGKMFSENMQGMRHWSGGALALCLSGILFCLREESAGVVMITLGNALFKIRVNQPRLALLYALVVMVFVFITLKDNTFYLRALLVSAVVTLLYCGIFFRVARHVTPRVLKIIWLAILLAGMVSSVSYFISHLFMPHSNASFYGPVAMNKCYLISLSLVTQLLPVFFFLYLMHNLKKILEKAANTDVLTGAENRRALMAFISTLNPARYTLYLIDIDNFKQINDQFGHDIGDQVLRHFAGKVTVLLGKGDFFARLGGEEFLVLRCRPGEHHVTGFAEALLGSLRQGEGPLPPYTASIGIVVNNRGDFTFSQALIEADKALYQVKATGKNNFMIAKAPVFPGAAQPAG